MIMKLITLSVFFFNITLAWPLTISIIIPCHPRHAQYLYSLLTTYEQQTVLADEVVISLSEAKKISQNIINCITTQTWKFPVKLIQSNEKLYAGKNRNKACDNATGDIFICQDADDVPHPQRVEIIKYFFEHQDIAHLMHRLRGGHLNYNINDYFDNIENIECIFPKSYWEGRKARNLHNGNIALSRDVFSKVKWSNRPRGQDLEFNEKVYELFKNKCIVIKSALVWYRSFLSSGVNK